MSAEKEIKSEEIVPMAKQTPFGLLSESDKWFEHTFPKGEENSIHKKAVVILAHPDDAEDLLGGTIVKLSEQGFDTTLVIVTDGQWGVDHRNPMSPNDLIRIRLEETLLGARGLGVGKVINLGIEDREVPEDPKADKVLLHNLVEVLSQNPASVYLTHATPENNDTKDYHADHRNTAKLALEAIQRPRNGNGEMAEQPLLLYADTQGARNAHGITRRLGRVFPKAAAVDMLIDITEVVWRKEKAFSFHMTQIGNTPKDVAHDYVVQGREVSRFRARQARRRFLRKPHFAEGLSLHTGHGFSTDITRVFKSKDVFTPKRIFTRRRAPIFY